MSANREYLVDKLHEKERAEEDSFFASHDRALIEKLHGTKDEDRRLQIRELTSMRCPDCGARLKPAKHYGVTIEECPAGHGMWLTNEELHTVAKREHDSWLRRYLYWLNV
jgi:hypothetical protein